MNPLFLLNSLTYNDNDFMEWISLPSLVPLVMSLPEDAWRTKVSSQVHLSHVIEIIRPLQFEEICQLRIFSKYIHHIGSITTQKFFNPESVNTVHSTCTCGKDDKMRALQQQLVWELAPSVYDVLETCGVIPLRNLYSYKVISRVEYENFDRVAGPNLVNLDFHSLGYNPKRLAHPRSKVFSFLSSLRVLRFHDCRFLNMVSNASIMQILRNAHSLRILHIPDFEVFDAADFRNLLLSNKTWRLEIGTSKSTFEASPSAHPLKPFFHLEATASHLKHCSHFLQKIGKEGCSSLYMLRARVSNDMPDLLSALPGLKKCLRQLQFVCDHGILTHVQIQFYNHSRYYRLVAQDILDHNTILDTISSLFVFRNLEGVKISYESSNFELNYDFRFETLTDKVKCHRVNNGDPEERLKKEKKSFQVKLTDVFRTETRSAHRTHLENFVRLEKVEGEDYSTM